MSKRKVKYLDKNVLAQINHISHSVHKYNRTLRPEAIAELPDATLFPIVFSMLHEHKAGEACEPHVRTIIAAPAHPDDKEITARIILDMPMVVFNALPEVELTTSETEKEDAVST